MRLPWLFLPGSFSKNANEDDLPTIIRVDYFRHKETLDLSLMSYPNLSESGTISKLIDFSMTLPIL